MEFVRAVIVGSGSSSSTPSLSCLASGKPCATCLEAHAHPYTSRNNRHNPSLLIQLRHPVDRSIHNVLIDCGKTFRPAALKVFPRYGVSDLSGLLLTHEHADACFGIDDLREYSRHDDVAGALDVYADRATLLSCHRAFRYLFPAPPPPASPGTAPAPATEEEEKDLLIAQMTSVPGVGTGWGFRATGATWTATLTWHLLRPLTRSTLDIRERRPPRSDARQTDEQAVVAGEKPPVAVPWPFVAVPVLHGRNYYSEAFLFCMGHDGVGGRQEGKQMPRLFFYCSDVSCVDEALHERLRTAKQLLLLLSVATASPKDLAAAAEVPLEVLVLDLLSWNSSYSTHFSAEEALAAAKELDAAHTFFVGMSHTVNHAKMTATLESMGLAKRMSAAYDGCLVAGVPYPPTPSE